MTSPLSLALDLFFPPRCILCGDPGDERDLCAGCRADLPRSVPCCERCGRATEPGAVTCPRCLLQPPVWDRLHGPLLYHPPVDWLVQRFKFDHRMNCGRLLASLMTEELCGEGPLPELLVPVPLHRERLYERGFNQAEFLARLLGKTLGLPVDRRVLLRTRPTQAQSELPAQDRSHNVRGAFSLGRLPAAGHVALVDDVLTTGHTATECVRVLRRAGLRRIDVWVAARTHRQDVLRLCA